MNVINKVYYLPICTEHVSFLRTEPIDGIHYVLHACMMQSETALGAPSIGLSDSRFFFKAGSIPSTRQAKDLPDTAELRLRTVM
jgi:hypothetical protein